MVLTRSARCIVRWLPNELLSEIMAFSPPATKLSLKFYATAEIFGLSVATCRESQLCPNSLVMRHFRGSRQCYWNWWIPGTLSPSGEEGPFSRTFVHHEHSWSGAHEVTTGGPAYRKVGQFPTSVLYARPPGMDKHPYVAAWDKQILLLWTAENPAIDAALSKLALLTSNGAQLTFSSLYIRDPTAAIVASLARHLPHAECVQLRSVANQTGRLDPEYIDAVSHQLLQFTQLRYLTLEFLALLDPVRDPALVLEDGESYAADRLTVEHWGRNCPTLRECCFHGNAWRLLQDRWTRVAERDLKELGNRKY
ncbi:hypothetical protein DFH06DRAFT_1121185 [Mycena polygramma]|nr:hypothetical protein DFH06DRAFT_1121185 [Mycena polygramma]